MTCEDKAMLGMYVTIAILFSLGALFHSWQMALVVLFIFWAAGGIIAGGVGIFFLWYRYFCGKWPA